MDSYLRSENMELMTFELSGVCVGQVCSEAIYDTEVAYRDSTEVRTHMAFEQQVRLPLLEKRMLIIRDPSIPSFGT